MTRTSKEKDGVLTIRNMTPADLGRALDWAAAEDWNPGLHDAACLFAADPNGFFIGEIKGESVGCIATVAYDQSFGWVAILAA